jgi:hypothetical protein
MAFDWRSGGSGVVLSVLIASAVPQETSAQRLACVPIRSGETAASVAARIAGDARHRHAAWFQIIDPATQRAVSKARYDRIWAGWHACLVSTSASSHSLSTLQTLRADVAYVARAVIATLSRIELTYVLWLLLAGVIVFASRDIENYLTHRNALRRPMKIFGEAFVREFDRSLVRTGSSDRAIDAQLRFRPELGRLDVLLAPRSGRRYPNLADHKKNVEYDVSRVLAMLTDPPIEHGPLRTDGRWVVVPFRFTLPINQDGAT